ncbi:MAG: hypothetical protein KGV56_03130 [Gammaproteobacteria bacterium]|nr:hypothetical protein [Gammaproteobacteria bacterium]
MARPRKPTKLKELNGSAAINPGRINKNEPKPTTPLSTAPSYFTKKEKQAWEDITSRIIDGVAFDCDFVHIELAAKLLASIRNPDKDDKGRPIVVVSAYAQLASLLAKLGMNPADRQKISIEPSKKEKDPWADFAVH